MEHLEALLLCCAALWAIALPSFGRPAFVRLEALVRRLAASAGLSLAVAALVPLVLRLALLPWQGVPIPRVHDEYSYLLQADTLAEGRLANPTHPHWRHFDTIHVNQRPTYGSKYPVGQGAALFLGERLFGDPWAGVLLSFAAASAAVVWAIRGWLSPTCALLGGILFGLQLGFSSNFIAGYMGGAVAALGGALVVGAWGRLRRRQTVAAGTVLGAGLAVLMYSRPYEGLLVSLPPLAALAVAAWRSERLGDHVRSWSAALLVCAIAAGFFAYYDYRTTGSATTTPYMVHQRAYHVVPMFLWGELSPAPEYSAASIEGLYRGWCLASWSEVNTLRGWLEVRPQDFSYVWFVLVGSLMSALLLLGHRSARDREIRSLWTMPLAAAVGLAGATWVVPHYFAPAVAALYVPITAAAREVWRRGPRPATFVRAVLLAVFAAQLGPVFARATYSPWRDTASLAARDCFDRALRDADGEDLVFVRYREDHNVHREWVYNRAEIDAAEVVWAHDFGETRNRELVTSMSGRRVWLARPDEEPPSVEPWEAGAGNAVAQPALERCSEQWRRANPPKASEE